MKIYKKQGRSEAWKRLKNKIEALISDHCQAYLLTQKQHVLADDANRSFFKTVRSFQSGEKPKDFDVRTLFPGRHDKVVAEELAEYFNKVSQEFSPLSPDQIPVGKPRNLPLLSTHKVAGRVRHFKKPKSMVKGDIFPELMTQCADLLAVPLIDIYNTITTMFRWPIIWKKEYVTVIPKTTHPESLADLRSMYSTGPPMRSG